MILACSHLSKAFGTDVIIKDATFNIEEREKAAIIGINGAGKSTLLKMIVGELGSDGGDVAFAKDSTYGYLAQHQNLDSDNSIYEEVLSTRQDVLNMEASLREWEAKMNELDGDELNSLIERYTQLSHDFEMMNGYAYRSEVAGVLKGLGFAEEDFSLSVNTLSGGQKTRVALSKLLLSRPDLIMLDEPTNHLDMNSIAWLEDYLSNYDGSVIIVAHDRYFLDKIVSKIIEIDNGTVTTFSGNYTDYASKKAVLRNMQLKAYLNQQREIKHQEEVITKLKQFNREKSIKRAESREKMLGKIEVLDKPTDINDKMNLQLTPQIESGNDVLSVTGLAKTFDDKLLFSDITFDIKKGERVALIGNNGTGKTTMLKIINGLLAADRGIVELGSNVEIGYYDQEHHVLDPDKTLFSEIQDAYPNLNNTKIRNTLAAFLFTGDDVFKYIRELSGGEKGRVSLAKLMLSNANFLILDEPTNHLDITSKEILENALNSYTGTVLYVSHDRYFINTTATRIIELTGTTTVNFIGNYDYYLEKRDTLTPLALQKVAASISASMTASDSTSASAATDTVNYDSRDNITDKTSNNGTDIGYSSMNSLTKGNSSGGNSKESWLASKEEQARLKKLKSRLAAVEERISVIEDRISEIDAEYADPAIASNTGRLMELHKEKEALDADLAELYDEWETLSTELE